MKFVIALLLAFSVSSNAANFLTEYPDYVVYAYPDTKVNDWIELHCLTSSNWRLEGNVLYVGETVPCWYQGGKVTACEVVGGSKMLECKELDLLFD